MSDQSRNANGLDFGAELGYAPANLTELQSGDFALVDVLGTFLMGTVTVKRKRENLSLTETTSVNGTPILERCYRMGKQDWDDSDIQSVTPEVNQLVYPVSVHAARKK